MRTRDAYTLFFVGVLTIVLFWETRFYLHLSPPTYFRVNRCQNCKLYFESDTTYIERQKLQEMIKFGGRVKQFANKEYMKREGYNESFLDSLPIVRKIEEDFQPPECKIKSYSRSKKKVSVVMNYHNELPSLLLRSIYSVINNIPPENFYELILIDDASNLTVFFDLKRVEVLVKTFLVPVHHIRFEENRGLIYSRRYGCQIANGDVVLVLDSHVEVKEGFLEPMLDELEKDYRTVAAPVFDFWDTYNMKFWSYDGVLLGFDPYLTWNLLELPKTAEVHTTPAILGGAYMATKAFLSSIDYFGKGMLGWGNENIEIGIKTWFCGGRLVYVPCSRVLHFAANRTPINHGDRLKAPFFHYNHHIIIKSYFTEEEYHEFTKLSDPGYEKMLGEDFRLSVQQNRQTIMNNKCFKNYTWLRRKTMPQVESYDGDTLIAHTVLADGKCVEGEWLNQAWMLVGKVCPEVKAQLFTARLTKTYELRFAEAKCLDWGYDQAMFVDCHHLQGNQITLYDSNLKRIVDIKREKCLVRYNNTNEFGFGRCDSTRNEKGEYYIPQTTFKVVYHPELLNRSPP